MLPGLGLSEKKSIATHWDSCDAEIDKPGAGWGLREADRLLFPVILPPIPHDRNTSDRGTICVALRFGWSTMVAVSVLAIGKFQINFLAFIPLSTHAY
jgi:hypothetical protein